MPADPPRPARDEAEQTLRLFAAHVRDWNEGIEAEAIDTILARLAQAERERDENEGVFKVWRRRCEEAERRAEEAERVAERYEEALRCVSGWASAYPTRAFAEPDFNKADLVLKREGISMSAMHGTWGRHITSGVADICAAALQPPHQQQHDHDHHDET